MTRKKMAWLRGDDEEKGSPDALKHARFSLVLILKNAEASFISSALGTILAEYRNYKEG